MPPILLRNLKPNEGLCNGTRLLLRAVHNSWILEAEITGGDNAGRIVYIPHITLAPNEEDYAFAW